MSGRRAIHVHIGEVVLHGVEPGARGALRDAIIREVGALVARESRLPGALGPQAVGTVDGGTFPLPSASPAPAIASGIASAVHGALRR